MKKYSLFILIFLLTLFNCNAQDAQFRGNSILELRIVELSKYLSDSLANLLEYCWEINTISPEAMNSKTIPIETIFFRPFNNR